VFGELLQVATHLEQRSNATLEQRLPGKRRQGRILRAEGRAIVSRGSTDPGGHRPQIPSKYLLKDLPAVPATASAVTRVLCAEDSHQVGAVTGDRPYLGDRARGHAGPIPNAVDEQTEDEHLLGASGPTQCILGEARQDVA
jgi:hypothetical protein